MSESKPLSEQETDIVTGISLPLHVILFNDDVHSFDEVIIQLIKALKCSFQKAKSLTFEVHNNGKAIVFTGDLKKCLEVSSVLEEIELHTQIVS